MNPSLHNATCAGISEWLKIATEKLCDSAKARISAEIEAHYSEGVEALVNDGLLPGEAQVKALKDLGDPKVAAKRFRKKHLTEKEAEILAEFEAESSKRPSRWLFLFEILAVTFTLIMFLSLSLQRDWLPGKYHWARVSTIALICLTGVPLRIARSWAKALNGRPAIRRLLLIDATSAITSVAILPAIFLVMVPGWFITFILLVMFGSVLNIMRILKALSWLAISRKLKDDDGFRPLAQ